MQDFPSGPSREDVPAPPCLGPGIGGPRNCAPMARRIPPKDSDGRRAGATKALISPGRPGPRSQRLWTSDAPLERLVPPPTTSVSHSLGTGTPRMLNAEWHFWPSFGFPCADARCDAIARTLHGACFSGYPLTVGEALSREQQWS